MTMNEAKIPNVVPLTMNSFRAWGIAEINNPNFKMVLFWVKSSFLRIP